MSEDKTLTKIPQFDGHYDHWSEMMENLLKAKGLWGVIERGHVEPLEGTLLTDNQQALVEESRVRDHQVKHYLFQALDRTVFEQILDRSTAKIIWNSLKKKYGGNEKVKRALRNSLRREFEVMEQKKGETIDDYFERVTTVSNKLRSNNEDMPENKIVEKILRTLSKKFTYIVVSIEESTNIEEMTVDELQSSLHLHEQKFKRFKEEKDDQVLKVEDRFNRLGIRGRGRETFRGRGRGRRGRQTFNKATVECYKCHQLGHFQYECPNWDKEANYAMIDEDDDLLLMAQIDSGNSSTGNVWFLDSGYSNHVCNNEELFTSLDKTFQHSVKLGNNSRINIAGKGAVKITLNGTSYAVGNVYYVPDLKNNLLSGK
ncbi:hypothetical protein LIER_19199 [Lithospermum erythrorhizon]|uniref:CCHC-type domain-containing protein n=1 Tax=Lithospermum erythrorhizon TaxID=34254 RepID=A0AAV3QGU4_LITER